MEELLPLIIGIIWLVYTIYSKGKKKGERKQVPGDSQQTKAPSFLEQLFAGNEMPQSQPYEVSDDIEELAFVEDFDQEVINEPKEKPTPFLRNELSDFIDEGQVATIPSAGYMLEEKEDMESQDKELNFDLRKAIIYSEILNPPYIGYK